MLHSATSCTSMPPSPHPSASVEHLFSDVPLFVQRSSLIAVGLLTAAAASNDHCLPSTALRAQLFAGQPLATTIDQCPQPPPTVVGIPSLPPSPSLLVPFSLMFTVIRRCPPSPNSLAGSTTQLPFRSFLWGVSISPTLILSSTYATTLISRVKAASNSSCTYCASSTSATTAKKLLHLECALLLRLIECEVCHCFSMWNWKIYISFLIVLLPVVSAQIDNGNPANQIVNLINKNRTATKLPELSNSAGLGCMALQLLLKCTKNCTGNNTLDCRPPEVDITEVYAPNCGVELPTVESISGHIFGCYWDRQVDPEQAFTGVLVPNNRSLSLLQSKEHNEIGVGYVGEDRQGPFLWCILFSNGSSRSSFVLEGGKGIEQRTGCFSGANVTCSAGEVLMVQLNILVVVVVLIFCLVLQLVVVV
ncbi:hypothetical protein ZIOFF_058155 [Zingiber officinale]|uniref:Uncharacterized protein n=2 Tax=Zingiber officinale TaxID=94328 RepID=A0A8J5FAN3_ZINOF|nr:hypothetical protein ZIOFF_058155 [Zingiber officinale]